MSSSLPTSLLIYTELNVPSSLKNFAGVEPNKYLTLAECEKLSRTPELAFSNAFKKYLEDHSLFFSEEVLRGFCYSYLALWDQVSDENFVWLKVKTALHFKTLTQNFTKTELCTFIEHFNGCFENQVWEKLFTDAVIKKDSFSDLVEQRLSIGGLQSTRFYRELSTRLLTHHTEALAHDSESLVFLKDRHHRHLLIKDLFPYAESEKSIDFLCVSLALAKSFKLQSFITELCHFIKRSPTPGDSRLETFADYWSRAPLKLLKSLRKWQRLEDMGDIVRENFGAFHTKDVDTLVQVLHSSHNPRVLMPNIAELRQKGGILGSVFVFRNGHNFSGQIENADSVSEIVLLFRIEKLIYAFSNDITKAVLVWQVDDCPSLQKRYWNKSMSWTDLLKTKPSKVTFLPKTLNQVFKLESVKS